MIEIKRRRQQTAQISRDCDQTHADGLNRRAAGEHLHNQQTALKRKIKPFTDASGNEYAELYRAAYTFHEQHNPPQRDLEYWMATAKDMGELVAAYGNNEFFNGLLIKVYEELSRQMPAEESTDE